MTSHIKAFGHLVWLYSAGYTVSWNPRKKGNNLRTWGLQGWWQGVREAGAERHSCLGPLCISTGRWARRQGRGFSLFRAFLKIMFSMNNPWGVRWPLPPKSRLEKPTRPTCYYSPDMQHTSGFQLGPPVVPRWSRRCRELTWPLWSFGNCFCCNSLWSLA